MPRWLRYSFLGLALLAQIPFASSSTPLRNPRPLQAPIGVFAPAGEKTFEQAYNVKLNLPMREDDFIALVERLGLKYGGKGPQSLNLRNREPGGVVLRPLLVNYDMSNISHCYRVYGGFKLLRLRTEYYLALVNKQKMIVYVESRFEYVGILP